MTILITGGNGYIARELYEAFKDKHEVTKISRKDFDLISYIDTKNYFKDKYFDFVIHTAVNGGSRLKQEDWSVMDDNLIMYYNLLRQKNHYGKFIHFGSGADRFDTPYGISKKVIANSIIDLEGFYNIRIFAVFNERELDTRFIKANITRYLNKEKMIIHQDQFMDFFYMKDLIKLVEYYLTAEEPPKSVDCSYPDVVTLSNIADMINSLGDYKVEVRVEKKITSFGYSGMAIDLDLDYIGLEEGIREVYNKLQNEKNKFFNQYLG
jgi:nucleoside-diphosphate-sugar epimerase